jgi:hypothetical protein
MKRFFTAILLATVLAGIPVFATALNRTEPKAGLTSALASPAPAQYRRRRYRRRYVIVRRRVYRRRHFRRLRIRRRHVIVRRVSPGDHNWIHNPTRSALRRGRRN